MMDGITSFEDKEQQLCSFEHSVDFEMDSLEDKERSFDFEMDSLEDSESSFDSSSGETSKTRKCLFGPPEMSTSTKPKKSPQRLSMPQPKFPMQDKSPFHLFKVKKRNRSSSMEVDSAGTRSYSMQKSAIKRMPFTPLDQNQGKGNDSSPWQKNSVKLALQRSIQNPDLIGDFSQNCSLPIIKGKNPDLMTIAPETVASVLSERQKNFYLIDCRYPYEYFGGHVQGAVNLYLKEDSERRLFHDGSHLKENNFILIFYCEFSSKRAPNMYRFVRSTDRNLNKNVYPSLFFPEMYLMEGGYESFFQLFKQYCDPPLYKKMLDPSSAAELALFRGRCKTKNTSRRLSQIKSGLKF